MTKDSGHDNPAYNLPEGVTNIYQLVTQSRMTDDVGEVFRLLYTHATYGKHYAFPSTCTEITDLARHFNFNGFMYDAMQALYRSGTGSRNNLERDMEKAQYYVYQEWKRLENNGDYNEWLEAAQDLMTEIVGKPYAD